MNLIESPALNQFVTEFKQLSLEDVIEGIKGVTFGGISSRTSTGVTVGAQGYPWRGTRNQFESEAEAPVRWTAAGTLEGPPDYWWLRTMPWMSTHYEVPLLLAAFYLVVIFGTQRYLKNRPPVKWLQSSYHIALWNLLLSGFSLLGTLSALPALYDYVYVQGFGWARDVCLPWPEWHTPWTFIFCLSKVPELFDTLFLVLKKKPVIFLHWYHHIATMMYCWDSWAVVIPQAGFFATMNYFVHTIMYFYYFLVSRPFGFVVKLPSFVPTLITTLQISQMFAGLGILYFCLQNCPTSYLTSDFRVMLNLLAGVIMYISYAILFSQLFIGRYIFGSRNKAPSPDSAPAAAATSKNPAPSTSIPSQPQPSDPKKQDPSPQVKSIKKD